MTYACNPSLRALCLSSSGKRDPGELSTRQCKDIIDELERMQVFYVNIGGGGPTGARTFWGAGGLRTARRGEITPANGVGYPEGGHAAGSHRPRRRSDLTRRRHGRVNDAIRGAGRPTWRCALRRTWQRRDFAGVKISVVITRRSVAQLDEFATLASRCRRRCG